MNLEPNNKSLSFAEFLDVAIRDKAEAKPFPYTLEVGRCRYCSFCQNGKCALKRCCCMNERVKARSCTFAELLRDCFANFKDNVFQFRLRIACERATELHTCFLDAGHRARFYEGVSYMRKKDPKFIAQLYLLYRTGKVQCEICPYRIACVRVLRWFFSQNFQKRQRQDYLLLEMCKPYRTRQNILQRLGRDRGADASRIHLSLLIQDDGKQRGSVQPYSKQPFLCGLGKQCST